MREIRKAVPTDVPFLAELEKECFADPVPEDMIARHIEDPMRVVLVALDGETPAGSADFQFVLDEGYIGNVAVFGAYRRNGVGRALVEALLAEAGEKKLAFLTLEVRVSNVPARALYEKCGFSVVGQRKNYYEKPTEDAILMTKYL